MRTFEGLHHDNRLYSPVDNSTVEVMEWRGEMYLASERSMWLVSEFDPADWIKL